jgi:hypothetical protein
LKLKDGILRECRLYAYNQTIPLANGLVRLYNECGLENHEFDGGSAPPEKGLLSADKGASFDKVMLL